MWVVYPVSLYSHPFEHLMAETVHIVEDAVFCGFRERRHRFNRLKMVYMHATCLAYLDELRAAGVDARLVAPDGADAFYRSLKSTDRVSVHDPTDLFLTAKLRRHCRHAGAALEIHPSRNFLTTTAHMHAYLEHSKGRYFHKQFYEWQRRRLSILVDSKGRPDGGKFSFDTKNRKAVPKGAEIPELPPLPESDGRYVEEADRWVDTHFGDSPGGHIVIAPVTRAGARARFRLFVKDCLVKFGDYEDAIVRGQPFLWHSVCSACLNVGLLEPRLMLDAVLAADAPLNCVEGFVRQIIGFCEYVRMLYVTEHDVLSRSNFLGQTRRVPRSFYDASTGLVPLDDAIRDAWRLGYVSHIPRLIVLAGAMTAKITPAFLEG